MSASFILTCHRGFARMSALIRIIASSRSVLIFATGNLCPPAKGSGKAAVSDNSADLPMIHVMTHQALPVRRTVQPTLAP